MIKTGRLTLTLNYDGTLSLSELQKIKNIIYPSNKQIEELNKMNLGFQFNF